MHLNHFAYLLSAATLCYGLCPAGRAVSYISLNQASLSRELGDILCKKEYPDQKGSGVCKVVSSGCSCGQISDGTIKVMFEGVEVTIPAGQCAACAAGATYDAGCPEQQDLLDDIDYDAEKSAKQTLKNGDCGKRKTASCLIKKNLANQFVCTESTKNDTLCNAGATFKVLQYTCRYFGPF